MNTAISRLKSSKATTLSLLDDLYQRKKWYENQWDALNVEIKAHEADLMSIERAISALSQELQGGADEKA